MVLADGRAWRGYIRRFRFTQRRSFAVMAWTLIGLVAATDMNTVRERELKDAGMVREVKWDCSTVTERNTRERRGPSD